MIHGKILQNGHPMAYSAYYDFFCRCCGCRFRVDTDDIKIVRKRANEFIGEIDVMEVRCPQEDCGALVASNSNGYGG